MKSTIIYYSLIEQSRYFFRDVIERIVSLTLPTFQDTPHPAQSAHPSIFSSFSPDTPLASLAVMSRVGRHSANLLPYTRRVLKRETRGKGAAMVRQRPWHHSLVNIPVHLIRGRAIGAIAREQAGIQHRRGDDGGMTVKRGVDAIEDMYVVTALQGSTDISPLCHLIHKRPHQMLRGSEYAGRSDEAPLLGIESFKKR